MTIKRGTTQTEVFLTPDQRTIQNTLIGRASDSDLTPCTALITYGELDRQLGRLPDTIRHRQLAFDLAAIAHVEHRSGRPLLPALVVRRDTQMPGLGFARMALDLGYLCAQGDEVAFWADELGRVLRYWRAQ
jgi:hypothetical protein